APKIRSSEESGDIPPILYILPFVLLLISSFFLYIFAVPSSSPPSNNSPVNLATLPNLPPSSTHGGCLNLDLQNSDGVNLKGEHCLQKRGEGDDREEFVNSKSVGGKYKRSPLSRSKDVLRRFLKMLTSPLRFISAKILYKSPPSPSPPQAPFSSPKDENIAQAKTLQKASILTAEQTKVLDEYTKLVKQTYPDLLSSNTSQIPWGGPSSVNTPAYSPFTLTSPDLLESYMMVMKFPPSQTTTFPSRACPQPCPTTRALSNTVRFRSSYKPWSHPGQWLGGLGRTDPRRYYVVMDCTGFGLGMIPGIAIVKKLFGFVGDHYPRRLGKLIIINISRPANVFWNMVKNFVPEDVGRKVHIASDKESSRIMMERDIDPKDIPRDYGGLDDWVFDADEYYGDVDMTEEESMQYEVDMPWQAA
ncbi:hypothetical protein TrRE_jg8769, partial [Triparma retinervis]